MRLTIVTVIVNYQQVVSSAFLLSYDLFTHQVIIWLVSIFTIINSLPLPANDPHLHPIKISRFKNSRTLPHRGKKNPSFFSVVSLLWVTSFIYWIEQFILPHSPAICVLKHRVIQRARNRASIFIWFVYQSKPWGEPFISIHLSALGHTNRF